MQAAGRLKCPYCRATLQLSSDVTTQLARPSKPAPRVAPTPCPGCLRTASGAAGTATRCNFCGLTFLPDRSATVEAARFGPLDNSGAITRDDLANALTQLPRAGYFDLVAAVLRARAERAELSLTEAHDLTADVACLTTWQPQRDGQFQFPLPMRIAEGLLPRLIAGTADYGVFRKNAYTDVVAVLGYAKRTAVPSARGTLRAMAMAALDDDAELADEVETRARLQVCLRIRPSGGDAPGLTWKIANQRDLDEPVPLTDPQMDEVRLRAQALPANLRRYFMLNALFGIGSRWGAAFAITSDAIALRFAALQLALPGSASDFCLRQPTVLATP